MSLSILENSDLRFLMVFCQQAFEIGCLKNVRKKQQTAYLQFSIRIMLLSFIITAFAAAAGVSVDAQAYHIHSC